MLAKSLQAPYYAVVFISTKSDDLEGYQEYDELTLKLAQEQPGFLGYENTGDGKNGIFISYWASLADIENWRKHPIHLEAKARAHQWYSYYHSQICLVENSRTFDSR